MNTHIINKQIIDLKVNSEENAFGLQQQVRDVYLDNVLPLIGEVLDELAGPDEVLRIDRIELDFGILNPDKMQEQMKERIREALLKQLPKLKRANADEARKEFTIIETDNNGEKSKAQLMSESFSQREMLAAFFETGILPWWSSDERQAPDIDAILNSLLEKEPVTTLHWLQSLAIKSPYSIKRMVMQVEKSTYKKILATFPEKIIAELNVLSKQLQKEQNNSDGFPWKNEPENAILFSALMASESFSQRELLEIFFETGNFPLQAADEMTALSIDAIFVSLFEKEPVTTLQWLQALAIKSPNAIRRLVMQVRKTTYNQILAALPEKTIATLQTLSKQIQQVQNSTSNFPWQKEPEYAILFSALILPPDILNTNTESSTQKILKTFIIQLSIAHQTNKSIIEQQLYANTLSGIISSHNKASTTPDVVEYLIAWEKKHPEIASSVTESNYPSLEVFSENDHLTISKLADTIERALKKFEEKQLSLQIKRKEELIKTRKKSFRGKKQFQHEEFQIEQEQELQAKEKHELEINQEQDEQGQDKQEQDIQKQNASVISQKNKMSSQKDTDGSENAEQTKDSTESIEVPSSPIKKQPDDVVKNIDSDIISQKDQNDSVKVNWFKTDEKGELKKISGEIEINSNSIPLPKKDETKIPEAENNKTISAKKETEEVIPSKENKQEPEEQITVDSYDENDEALYLEDHPLFGKKPSAGMTRFGGLILIAPFLPAFFSELKLIVDGKFPSETEQHKALHLLAYLASGKTSSPEYALLLHKLLCGIEITKPVPKSVKLSAAEKKESMIFLDDVAEQWTALRSASGKALRDTFFRRNGILEKKDNTWLLRVERGPMDIMLDTLPWTISIIKAPWMQQLLQVEW